MGTGLELRRIREENGNVSVKKIAAIIGIDAARWRKWESLDLNPRQDDQAKIEAFFRVDMDELYKVHKVKLSSKKIQNIAEEPFVEYESFIKIKPTYVQKFTTLH